MKKRGIVIGWVVVALALVLFCGAAQAEVLTKSFDRAPWTQFPGDFRLTPAFPDTCSRYNTFVFKPHTGDFDMLKVTGKFPHARYFSFNLYEFYEATDFDALADYEIEPDPTHTNPFEPGVDRNAEKRSYTIWLVKDGIRPPVGAKNVFMIPFEVETAALFMRIYRPDQGYDSLGGVDLPRIESLKRDRLGRIVSGPAPDFGLTAEAIASKVPLFLFNGDLEQTWESIKDYSGNRLAFFRLDDGGLFPNAHNEYLISPLTDNYANKVAVVTLIPPTSEDATFTGGDFQGGKDVRYWSFCLGGLGATATPDCLCDDQVRKNSDGTVTIVVAPFYLKNKIKSKGLNYMKWGATYLPVLLHRHMLADDNFSGSIGNVPKIDRPPLRWQLHRFNEAGFRMGEYAPQGEIMSVLEFLRWLRRR